MLRRMLLMLGAVIVVVLILAALKFNSIYSQIQQFKAPKPPINVEVVTSASSPGRAVYRPSARLAHRRASTFR